MLLNIGVLHYWVVIRMESNIGWFSMILNQGHKKHVIKYNQGIQFY
jgi:hypothetical protein